MPTLTVHFFAGAAQASGCERADVPFDTAMTIYEGALQAGLKQGAHKDDLSKVLSVSSFLVDGTLHKGSTVLNTPADTRVDVLPPFAGG
ncbi:MAG: hypothetical protein Q4P66_06265 [Actinomycetaceae bacterium]|nr:hypothetical protein [Actinomycetaceae bacterium]